MTPRHAAAAAALLLALCLAYQPHVGHGFIRDDFRWISESRLDSVTQLPRLAFVTLGFYRPLVCGTFSANYAISGLDPRPYGVTNFLLLVVDAMLVFLIAGRLRLGVSAALLSAAAWSFNFHGINMAVLWISGRTALVLACLSMLTTLAVLGGRRWLAGVLCLLALLSKEEAVTLPAVLSVWMLYEATGPWSTRVAVTAQRAWPLWLALAVYVVLRMQTAAFWVRDAPPYYRLTFEPGLIARNVLEYVDRAATWPMVPALALAIAAGGWPQLDRAERRVVVYASVWLACGFAVTMFVPLRSSLYAVVPSIGTALAAGAFASAAIRARPARVSVACGALALLPFLLLPVYWSRNARWVDPADLSSHTTRVLREIMLRQPGIRHVVLVDDPAARTDLEAAFGGMLSDAVTLLAGAGATGEITRELPVDVMPHTAVLRFKDGRLERVR